MINDLKIFPILLFETAELWCIVGLIAILRLLLSVLVGTLYMFRQMISFL